VTAFLTSASFEERCTALSVDLPPCANDDPVIILDFDGYNNVAPYLFNLAKMKNNFRKKGYKIYTVNVRLNGPLNAIRRIESILSSLDVGEILLDISTLPRNLLFCVCRLFATIGTPTRIRYYRPSDYGSELSRGIGGISSIPGFEGDVRGSGETVLVVILGFEGYKALHAWEQIGASRVVALYGDPPYEPEFLEISKKNNADFIEAARSSKLQEMSLHTFDVLIAKSQLKKIYKDVLAESPENSFILCPLGTKPQSLAAFAFAYENEGVAVAYVSSLIYYTDEYSRGFRREFTELSLSDLITT